MFTRNIIITCTHQFNAVYKGGQLRAIKRIKPGETIHLKREPNIKLERQLSRELKRLEEVSLKHAKIN